MSLRYQGGFITASPPSPSTSAASGVWSLIQQMQAKGNGNWPLAPAAITATGGTIISIKDENKISSTSDLYVISLDQNIADEIGKIITLHYLKS